ncbi:MAG: ChbG/HpnK family deacetylase [Hyphomicrobiales bacterium]|nr:ChbG/HpnK family deacetylase [Hyphomicrobiales bacterium]
MPRSFILCADDLGLSPAVSAGIVEAAARGRISAASAMVNLPSWPAAARDWQASAPTARLGLHLNLTIGEPLSALHEITGQRTLPPLGFWLRNPIASEAFVAALEREIAAQLDAFVAFAGHAPAHIDGHQHVQVLPSVAKALTRVLQARGAGAALWLRDSSDTTRRILQRGGQTGKALAIKLLARGFGARLRRAGLASNHGFSGFSGFDPALPYGDAFAGYLKAPGPRHLVMCHPGYIDDELRARDRVTATRPQELAFLLSSAFEDLLGAHDARLAQDFGPR